jgi:hypothetical protein
MSDLSLGGRPQAVDFGAKLLWVSAVITLLATIAGRAALIDVPVPGSTMVSNLITTAILALCAWKIGAGRNWARWVFLVVWVLGSGFLALVACFAPQALRGMSTVLVTIAVVQTALQTAALILTFMPASNAWFRARALEPG